MILYMPLESYNERYTYQLREWTEQAFKKQKVAYMVILGLKLGTSDDIKTGRVLDAHGRTHYSVTQMGNLITHLQSPTYDAPNNDCIFFEDLFTPGFEALPYIFEQIKHPPKIFTKCLAQSIDSDDFTFPWRDWMRDFEMLVSKTVDGIFIANTAMGINMEIALVDKAPLYVTGLSFDADEVRSRVKSAPRWHQRSMSVAFASRFDKEKQPHLFLDVIQKIKKNIRTENTRFCIFTGAAELRSTDPSALVRVDEYIEKGWVEVRKGLSKDHYYDLLSQVKVLFNSSLQDWQSNTLNEACALGTAPLFPAYKSFPEALNNNKDFLYVPWSVDDAVAKLTALLLPTLEMEGRVSKITRYVAREQSESINNMIAIMIGTPDVQNQFKYKPFNYSQISEFANE